MLRYLNSNNSNYNITWKNINKNSILYKDDSNTIEIKILDDENALKLFNNLILMLKDLAKDYPKNIKIESEK